MVLVPDKSQIMPGPLKQVQAAYRNAVAPAGEMRPTPPTGHFAPWTDFSLDEPQALRRLAYLAEELGTAPGLDSLLPRILDRALLLMGADFGHIQLLDPAAGVLRIVAQSGFGPEFLDYFAVVDDDRTAGGRAARSGVQAVIADVSTDPGSLPHRAVAAAAGFQAVQSTPLAEGSGRLIGAISTYFRRPHHPSGRDLRIMELYGNVAGEAVARHLSGHPRNASDPALPLRQGRGWTADRPDGPGPARAAVTADPVVPRQATIAGDEWPALCAAPVSPRERAAVLRTLIDELPDGVALVYEDGTLALASRRLEGMFGYGPGELAGFPVESLIPVDMQAAHRAQRTGYSRAPAARPMGARVPMAGLRKDGTTFLVSVGHSPVPAATRQLTLAVIRDLSRASLGDDPGDRALAAGVTAVHDGWEVMDSVVTTLFEVGLSLQVAADQYTEAAERHIAKALRLLDGTIHKLRAHSFATGTQAAWQGPGPISGDAPGSPEPQPPDG